MWSFLLGLEIYVTLEHYEAAQCVCGLLTVKSNQLLIWKACWRLMRYLCSSKVLRDKAFGVVIAIVVNLMVDFIHVDVNLKVTECCQLLTVQTTTMVHVTCCLACM